MTKLSFRLNSNAGRIWAHFGFLLILFAAAFGN